MVASPVDTKKEVTNKSYIGTPTFSPIPSVRGKVAIVTGGNSGIGFQLCKFLAFNGAKVYVACRSEEKGQDAIKSIQAEGVVAGKKAEALDLMFVKVNLGDLKQTKQAAVDLAAKVGKIDILICNAGIMDVISSEPYKVSMVLLTKLMVQDGYENMFSVNHLGHFVFTTTLLPVLLKTPGHPRVVMLSSYANWRAPNSGIDFECLVKKNAEFTAVNLYGQSKLANILFANELTLRHPKIIANSVHPGIVTTNLLRPTPGSLLAIASYVIPKRVIGRILVGDMLTPEEGCLSALWAATALEVEEKHITGKYVVPFGAVSDDHHPLAMDKELAKKLWEFSETACAKF
ncbi:hypothetical protein HK100_002529 [Physocladia obscura]|uniref:NAD(P)-binding protein n=1 Tax=Physocladia obscura TaxID=109957 RepID=A0AAD5XE60_9FUNG|nr:hypothetical protein HK100_002529 [Physocladia obscura]